jgi:hypothetical protein
VFLQVFVVKTRKKPLRNFQKPMKRIFSPHPRRAQRGEGRAQFIITLAVIGTLIFVGYKTLPVYWQEKNFQYEIEDLTRKAAIRSKGYENPKKVQEQFERTRNQFEVPVEAQFGFEDKGGVMRTTVNYTVPIDFFVYTYDWTVKIEVKENSEKYR